ncbi:flagellin [Aliarcobacter cibarius]|jgi:flagellin|uniref:Flagellin n=1 Tax=Aliarcobacter cibarius TaxID=255507 RepID=A0A5J6RK20_9BACT|nr:flagellin [Aliarcobacter cibarius]MBP9490806.1 flagellin [Aliarcobacter sp.]QEZ89148.1 putative flagellar protein [Aliarcobacter cibarius]QKJ27183.1 putative flagellar protein [Aliarcobacter cibarius]TLT01595.1 flagellin [Aliarcobacter cibarius]TLT02086.1 flagellin [Aliarcobacter cibarius]
MQINSNNSLLNQNVYLNANQALTRIATGIELNRSSDNASSLAIANNLLSQSSGYSQAIENTNSAVAATQITSGATNEQSKILDNIKEKLLQASTDTTSKEGRDAILKDIKSQLEQFDKIASSTNYNGQSLLQKSATDNSASNIQQYQSGLKGENLIETPAVQSNTTGLGLSNLVNQDSSTFTSEVARNFLETVDKANNGLNTIRSEMGSIQNQLESSGRNLLTQRTNTQNAASMFDTDYAKESSNFSKQNILAKIGAFGQAQSSYINQQIVSRLIG